MTHLEPTIEMSQSLQEITNYLDALLFNGELPPCYITLTRNNKVIGGYHSSDQWENAEGDKVPEIGVNSNLIAQGDPITLYNVLIHELIHLELTHKGTHGRVGYHNKAFAQRCHDLGLSITIHDKDAKPGQETGQSMATDIIPGGKAEKAIAQIPTDLAYYTSKIVDIDSNGQAKESDTPPKTGQGQAQRQTPPKTKSAGKRTKYTCAQCGLNLWGKSGASVICGKCMEHMIAAV